MKRALVRAGLLLAVLAGVSACGNKGPLVLPDKDKDKQAEPAKADAKKDAARDAPQPDAPRR
jgi:predicted small lipoprotein YifL